MIRRRQACSAGMSSWPMPQEHCGVLCGRDAFFFCGLHTAGELRLTLQQGPVSFEVHHLSMNVHRTVNESHFYMLQPPPSSLPPPLFFQFCGFCFCVFLKHFFNFPLKFSILLSTTFFILHHCIDADINVIFSFAFACPCTFYTYTCTYSHL